MQNSVISSFFNEEQVLNFPSTHQVVQFMFFLRQNLKVDNQQKVMKRVEHFYGLSSLQLNTRANCSVYNSVQVAALFSKVISGTNRREASKREIIKESTFFI